MTRLTMFLFFTIQFVVAQQSDYKTDALKVYELSGAKATIQYAKATISKMSPLDKQALFLKDFDDSLSQFYDDVAKNYMDVYSHNDLKAMIVFYQSEVGQKIAKNSVTLLEKTQSSSKK